MEEKKGNGFAWIREHKKELIITGISVGATIALYFGLKNSTLMERKFEVLKNVVSDETEKLHFVDMDNINVVEEVKKAITRAPHEVRMHPRKLPGEQKPSSEVLAYAKEIDFPLAQGQTLVKAYHTGEKAA